ncbi:MAG: PEP-CTERM sorting domain-containing protein [Gammaproteobacteria bacterium]|nr:PEP-CTERM sorting domain-containing protein [Gammaproteobacteria bacterium]MDH5694735.1 PEP-CTERM sorting domain-containing protein [Gammaproteobacteria bacterium]
MRVSQFILAVGLFLSINAASAVVIDTTDDWTGDVNNNWEGGGQSITVDSTENYLDDISFFFDVGSNGLTFDFFLTDDINGGNILFSDNFVAAEGQITFDTNVLLDAGAQIYALINYNGFTGDTTHLMAVDSYSGGTSYFLRNGVWNEFADYELSFIANFIEEPNGNTGTNPSTTVPLPTTLVLLGLGLFALNLRRNRAV